MTTNEKYTRQNERLDHQIARKKEMKSILTPEQFEKYEKMSHRKDMRGHIKREGGRKGKRTEKK